MRFSFRINRCPNNHDTLMGDKMRFRADGNELCYVPQYRTG